MIVAVMLDSDVRIVDVLLAYQFQMHKVWTSKYVLQNCKC